MGNNLLFACNDKIFKYNASNHTFIKALTVNETVYVLTKLDDEHFIAG